MRTSAASSATSAVRPCGSSGWPCRLRMARKSFADFLAELEALGHDVLAVQASLGFHMPDVVLDLCQGGVLAQGLHGVGSREPVSSVRLSSR